MEADRVGKYRIIAKLGQGGMATVYLSIAPGPMGFNKLLVVKVLREELSSDPDFLAMFLNEARLAARLNHANVVHTYEVGVEAGQHYLAMDYLDGQPLHAVLRRASRSTMPLDLHVRILADALAGLHYAHTLTDFDGTPLHVVHRDVSPQNVFVTYDGQVKVVDFGIAKAAGASSTTQSGVFKGKMAYVAPEQAGGDPVDARSDLFSVGVMLWEAMAGRRFAKGDSQTAILARRLAGTEPRIRDEWPDADPELADICDKAMAHRPADRFADALEFRDALEAFLDRFTKRVGTREVGDFVSDMFADERASIRKVIDEQMKRVMRETSQALPLPSLEVHGPPGDHTPLTSPQLVGELQARLAATRAPGSLSGTTDHGAPSQPALHGPTSSPSGIHGTLATSLISQAPPAPPHASKALLWVFGALAAASVAGVAFVLFTQRTTPPPPTAATGAPATSQSPTAPAADRITVSITFGPPGAIAKLDGAVLAASPFVAQVPRDGSMHRLDVEAPGLAPETRMVTYDADVKLEVTLVAPVASAAPTAAPQAPVRTGPRPPVEPTSPKPPATREIDEQDPYKK